MSDPRTFDFWFGAGLGWTVLCLLRDHSWVWVALELAAAVYFVVVTANRLPPLGWIANRLPLGWIGDYLPLGWIEDHLPGRTIAEFFLEVENLGSFVLGLSVGVGLGVAALPLPDSWFESDPSSVSSRLESGAAGVDAGPASSMSPSGG